MTRRARRASSTRTVAALGFAAVLVVGPACTSSTEQFCDQLRELYALDDLARAIETEDQDGIESGLADLRRLEEEAPPEIHDDLRHINDTMIDVVRYVTGSEGPEGQAAPVDPADLRRALAAVGDSAQHVTEFADEECGLTL